MLSKEHVWAGGNSWGKMESRRDCLDIISENSSLATFDSPYWRYRINCWPPKRQVDLKGLLKLLHCMSASFTGRAGLKYYQKIPLHTLHGLIHSWRHGGSPLQFLATFARGSVHIRCWQWQPQNWWPQSHPCYASEASLQVEKVDIITRNWKDMLPPQNCDCEDDSLPFIYIHVGRLHRWPQVVSFVAQH